MENESKGGEVPEKLEGAKVGKTVVAQSEANS
jgi:hypothetical protein